MARPGRKTAFVKICTQDQLDCGPANYDRTTGNAPTCSREHPQRLLRLREWHHPQEPGTATRRAAARPHDDHRHLGHTIVADMTMEPTGIVSGIVRAANGDPLENAEVWLYVQRRGSYVRRTPPEFGPAAAIDFAARARGRGEGGSPRHDQRRPGEAFGTVSTDQESTSTSP
jgi:hypothetical protein